MDDTARDEGEMARRERRWNHSRDPAALWPGVSLRALQSAADGIGVAAAGMLRDGRASLDAGADARVVGIAALLTGTGPLLGYWLERGTLDAPDEVATVLARHLAHGRARFARVRHGVAPVFDDLMQAGVHVVAMKGFHTAQAYFPDPGTRPFADVDIIVRPEEIALAEAVLTAAGFEPGAGSQRPYKRDWRRPDDTAVTSFEMWHARAPWNLEVHDGVNFDPMTTIGAGFGAARAVVVEPAMGGMVAGVLGQPLLLAALATHTSVELGPSRLLRLIELVLVIRRDDERGLLDWTAMFDLLARSRAERFVYPALALAERLAPGAVPVDVLARARRATTSRARALERRYTATAPIVPHSITLADRFQWTRTPGETFRALRHLALPGEPATIGETVREAHARLRRLFAKLATRRSQRAERDAMRDP